MISERKTINEQFADPDVQAALARMRPDAPPRIASSRHQNRGNAKAPIYGGKFTSSEAKATINRRLRILENSVISLRHKAAKIEVRMVQLRKAVESIQ